MDSLKKYLNREMLIILMMGLASGLPLALTGGTLQAWMKAEGVDLGTIGLFAFVGVPYTFKFLWSPLIDWIQLPFGRRKGWMFASQILLILSICGLGFSEPQNNLQMVALMAVLVAFFSATQDIVIDAWRRDALTDEKLGLGSSVHVTGYLFAFRMVSGALALLLSDFLPWKTVFLIMAAIMLIGVLATLLCEEPKTTAAPPKSLSDAVWLPLKDYFSQKGAWVVLIFILLYKVGDNMASQMTIPYFLEMGFARAEIGVISKSMAWVALSFGGLLGGALMLRMSLYTALAWFGVFQGLSTAALGVLTFTGHDLTALTGVILFENFTTGMGSAAFVAFMASLTNRQFTATQYALLTSLMGVPRTILAAPTGYMAQSMGWVGFFLFCALIALPGILMISKMKSLRENSGK